jgi:5'(3')-deoxyribonucleotidase
MKPYRSIAVDLDDVLFDFVGYFFQWHNEQYGTALQPEDIAGKKIWETWAGTVEEASERVPRFYHEVGMLELAPIDGAVLALEQLSSRYKMTVISARDPSTRGITQAWIDKYLPGVFDEIVLGIGDPMARGRPVTKAELCKQVGAQLLIDDQLVNARNVAAAGIDALLFGDYPWNQAGSLPPGIERVQDWPHVARVLR